MNLKQVGIVEKKLSYQDNNPVKVKTVLNLSNWYYAHYNDSKADAQKSLFYAYQALDLSKKIKFNEGNAESCLKLAVILQQAKDYLRAKIYAKKAVNGYQNLNLQDQLGESWVMYWSASFLAGMPYEQRIPLLQNAANAFHKAGNKEREADCYKEIGDIYQVIGNGPDSISSLKRALALYDKNTREKLYGVYDLMCSVYSYMGDHKTAIACGLKAASIAEKIDDKSIFLCTIYNRIGVAYYEFQDDKNAQKYYLRSLNIAIRYHDLPSIRELTHNYSDVLLKLHKSEAALKFLNLMKAKYHDLFSPQSTALECQYIKTYMKLHQYSKAQAYLKPVKQKIKNLNDFHDRMSTYFMIIKLSVKLKNYKEANVYSISYDSLTKKLKTNRFFATSSYLKYSIDSAQGNCNAAMNNYRNYVKYSKDLFDENKTKQINQMTILYETEKKDKNIIQLKNNSIIQNNKLRHASIMNNLMLISIISLLIIATLLYRVYRLKKQTNKILSEQQDEINKKNITLQNLVTEKEWLLKEIHHRVKNNLHMVVGLLASQVEFLKTEEAVQAINDSQNRIQAMSLIHQKLYQSENLSMISMPSYIFELTEYLKDSFDIGKSIRFVLDIDNFDLPLSHSIPIGLIFNEAVTNSIKYAFPGNAEGKINISLKAENDHKYILTIHDNGIGLAPDFDSFNNPSLGIRLMNGLSEDIKGKFEITNDNGTKVSLFFTLNETTIS
ncbi:histidine kinase dimerization/phosphoacceptor domain -containing protein [Flavobacterium sp. MC2016-06]|uniref:histidine kinase dimerization/phosphoacceptor domain -containing protein n=1 Tax=Flavobacterium sp. MC2016-06 TaxID=2676308 RepID=UPI0018ACAE6A|nr:tetratricopeptide repeat protein [Flavobacterium sp. MC2016-06]